MGDAKQPKLSNHGAVSHSKDERMDGWNQVLPHTVQRGPLVQVVSYNRKASIIGRHEYKLKTDYLSL